MLKNHIEDREIAISFVFQKDFQELSDKMKFLVLSLRHEQPLQ